MLFRQLYYNTSNDDINRFSLWLHQLAKPSTDSTTNVAVSI